MVDIGCGANALTDGLLARCHENEHRVVLIDSPEVLAHHHAGSHVRLEAGRFPDMPSYLTEAAGSCDAVVAYSVLQYVFAEASVHAFVDAALTLLAPGGRLLLGDLPSHLDATAIPTECRAGRAFHHTYTGRDDDPPIAWPMLPRASSTTQ